ncbi:MAG: 3'-5' exonuclease [Patescibacteria group bacterium]|jgi:DNA polymerase III alpha subunit (gram-positive type)
MKYIIYDLETTGLDHTKDQPIEIGIIKIDDITKEIEEYDIFIKPAQPISDEIKNLTGLTNEILDEKGVDISLAMPALFKTMGIRGDGYDEDVKIIGHNILRFDNLFLQRYADEMGYQMPGAKHYFDTAGEFRAMLLGEERYIDEIDHDFHKRILSIFAKGVRYNLTAACNHYGIAMPDDAHRANHDCRYTLRVFEKQKGIELVPSNLFNKKNHKEEQSELGF